MKATELDVAIAGGGLAGSLLARQLQRALPELHIGLFEKATTRSFKVGESIVELGSHYCVRRQGLSRYLYEKHLPKNGLRYFFDDEARNTSLFDMSEIGTTNLPFHPAFHVDRARLEEDLLRMNCAAGIHVRLDTRVREVELGEAGARHRLAVEERGKRETYSARWFVDATGRNGLLARQLGLRARESEHRIGSVWGRFEGVADVDDMGPESFRARIRYTSRSISTMHLWYPHYWIWFIPLRGGLTSIGVVGRPATERRELRSAEGLRAFLAEHRAAQQLLANAKNVDVGSYVTIAYGTRRFFHPDRWAVIGEAAQAADPLYSPGIDFIALENDFVSDLVQRDVSGADAEGVRERCELYEQFMQFRHEATLLLYRGLYGGLGSYDLMRLKWDFDLGCYYNLWVSPYMQNQYTDLRFLRRQLRQKPFILQALRNFADLFRATETALRERGAYYRNNLGLFSCGIENIDFVETVGMPRNRKQILEDLERLFNSVRARAVALLKGSNEPVAPLPLSAFMGDRSLV